MNITLRIFLLLVAVFTLLFVVRKLRKSALEIIDSIFWVTGIFGFDSSSNFVFFCGILVLLARLFTQDLKVATLKRKLTTLTQTEALKEHER